MFLSTKGKDSNLQASSDILRQHEVCPNLLGKFWNGEAMPDTRESVVELKAAQAVQLVSTLTAKPSLLSAGQLSRRSLHTEGTFGWMSDGRF